MRRNERAEDRIFRLCFMLRLDVVGGADGGDGGDGGGGGCWVGAGPISVLQVIIKRMGSERRQAAD